MISAKRPREKSSVLKENSMTNMSVTKYALKLIITITNIRNLDLS